jgi:hypothetical protein
MIQFLCAENEEKEFNAEYFTCDSLCACLPAKAGSLFPVTKESFLNSFYA